MSQGKSLSFLSFTNEAPQCLSDSDHFSDIDPDLDPDLDLGEGGASSGMRFGGRFWCLADTESEDDSDDDLTSNRFRFTKRLLSPPKEEAKTRKKFRKRGR